MSSNTTPQTKMSSNAAKEILWRRGHLGWLLDKNQQALYELFHKNPAKIQTWLLARRSGKSRTLCVLAIEYCLKHPKSIVKYVAPTKDQVEQFILPIIDNDILYMGGCPEDIKPQYIKSKKHYFFPNGSCIQLCGAEGGNIDSVRGGFAHIAIVDEAQDISKLRYAITSVLLPTTLTTKGKVLISGTPPQDADHEFVAYIERAEADGTLVKRTIYDNPRLSKEDIQIQIDAIGGEDREEFQREYLCKIVKSKTRSVIPEATDELLAAITKDWEKPPFYDAYTSMDIGGKDWTVVLFGYYDFKQNKIIIEDELVLTAPELHLPVFSMKIHEIEQRLWTSDVSGEFIKPKKRVSDHNPIVINEIKKFTNYKVIFENADKRDRFAAINWLRTTLANEQIIINPKCKVTLSQLKNVKWKSDNNKDEFARCPQGSHYDAVDALIYFVRAVELKHNPYPKDFNSPLRKDDAFYVPDYKENSSNMDVYRKLLNLRKR